MIYQDNWEIDIYSRIDDEPYISEVKNLEYKTEISWCFRLGYIDTQARDALLAYLQARKEDKEVSYRRQHETRLAQIRYNQEILRQKAEEEKAIKELFKKKG